MIHFKRGNIFNEVGKVEAIINTINTVGVMGKGIAKEFKIRYPKMFKEYKLFCDVGKIKVGRNYIYEISEGDTKYIINFPTKAHWRSKSKIEYIESGLEDLKKILVENNITSIAMPALGCGNGGLDWNVIKPLIEQELEGLDQIEIIIYEPSFTSGQNKKTDVPNNKKPKLSTESKTVLLLMQEYNNKNPQNKITYIEVNFILYLIYPEKFKANLKPKMVNVVDTNKILTNLAQYYIKPLNDVAPTKLEVINSDVPQKKSIISSEEYSRALDILDGFMTKELIKILGFTLWFFKNSSKDEWKEKINIWIDLNGFRYSENEIIKSINRIEKYYTEVENLKLDI